MPALADPPSHVNRGRPEDPPGDTPHSAPTAGEALENRTPDGEAPTPFTSRVWTVAAVAAMVAAAFLVLCYAPEAALLVFAAIWFAAALRHAAGLVGRFTHMSYGWNLTVVVTLLLAVILGSLFAAGWRVSGRVDELSGTITEARGRVEQLLQDRGMGGLVDAVPAPTKIVGGLMGGGSAQQSMEQRVLTAPLTFGVYVLFIFFAGLFLALKPGMYRDGAVSLFPKPRRDQLRRTMDDCGEALWNWTKARLAAMLITGVLTGIALYALGIPMAITLGVLTALLVFVPNIGAVLAAIPPVLIAFQVGGLTPVWVLAAYVGVQMLESYVITPYVIGEGTGVPPALVITAQLVFGILFGGLGVLFATPLILTAMIFTIRYWVQGRLDDDSAECPVGD